MSLRALAAAVALASLSSAAVPAGYSSLGSTVCSAAGAASVGSGSAGGSAVPLAGGGSLLPALPRRDRTGASISSDLGSYTLLTCGSGSSGALPCSIAPLPATSTLTSAAGAPGTIIQYVRCAAGGPREEQERARRRHRIAPAFPRRARLPFLLQAEGPLLYGALAILMAVLCVLFALALVISRYVCCCCCRANTCVGGCFTCGGAEPSRRSCGCGAVEVRKGGDGGGGDAGAGGGGVALEYPRAERWLTAALLAVFLLFILAFTIIGAVAGLTALPASLSQAAPVLTAAAQPWANALLDATQTLLVNLGSNTIAPNLLALNAVRARRSLLSRPALAASHQDALPQPSFPHQSSCFYPADRAIGGEPAAHGVDADIHFELDHRTAVGG